MLSKEKKMQKIEEESFLNDDLLETSEAAIVAGVTMACIRKWCEKYHIGKKIAGRWKVDPDRLELLVKGDMGQSKVR